MKFLKLIIEFMNNMNNMRIASALLEIGRGRIEGSLFIREFKNIGNGWMFGDLKALLILVAEFTFYNRMETSLMSVHLCFDLLVCHCNVIMRITGPFSKFCCFFFT